MRAILSGNENNNGHDILTKFSDNLSEMIVTSVNLLEDLLAKGVYACATISSASTDNQNTKASPTWQGVMAQTGNIVCII